MSALLVGLLAAPASAQLLFGYENGEIGMPYAGNPAGYITTLSNVGVTQGVQSLQTTAPIPAFGGPGNAAAFTDAGRATTINNSPFMLIDMTVPQKGFNFGNIDVTFFQAGMRGGAGNDETGFSPTFALSSGSTITLKIPLTNTQFGTPHIALDPSQPWSYQIDLSFGPASGVTGPYTFQFDNLRVPEPASCGLFVIGLVAAGVARRRSR